MRHELSRTTHDPRPTTHPPKPISQSLFEGTGNTHAYTAVHLHKPQNKNLKERQQRQQKE